MHQTTYRYLTKHPELINFVRHNPEWYRYLSRDPGRIVEIGKEAKKFYGKTIPQQAEKLSGKIQMVSMLLQVAGSMKD
ncbi:YlbE-like family protein [Virgibacillus kekensis]|uniref:YlbE-like family protein n=1 Tax=Virgibacillus kekensis TaxID=202261 RepID=A0ABV9DDV4_9BACI